MLADLAFAWRACRAVKSNAILLAPGGASVGVGMGQVNRVDSCRLAVERAGERASCAVAASDAFFPFADGPQILIDAGVKAIVQPGGSVRDDRGRRGLRGRRRDDVPHRRPALLPLISDLWRDRMTAQTLDGTATLRTIKAELAERVAALRERGVVARPRAPCWSATTPARTGTSAPSTRTAPRSASPRSGATCPPRPPRPRSRP